MKTVFSSQDGKQIIFFISREYLYVCLKIAITLSTNNGDTRVVASDFTGKICSQQNK